MRVAGILVIRIAMLIFLTVMTILLRLPWSHVTLLLLHTGPLIVLFRLVLLLLYKLSADGHKINFVLVLACWYR
jgi:hypothetical protein